MKTLSDYIEEKLIINQQVDEKLLINKNFKSFIEWNGVTDACILIFTKKDLFYIDLITIEKFNKKENKYEIFGKSFLDNGCLYKDDFIIIDSGYALYAIADYYNDDEYFCKLILHPNLRKEYINLIKNLKHNKIYNIYNIIKILDININNITFFENNKEFKMQREYDEINRLKTFLLNSK